MSEETIAEIPISEDRVHRVSRCVRNGKTKVQLREWFRSDAGDWRPGSKGFTIHREHAAKIVGAILSAATRARS